MSTFPPRSAAVGTDGSLLTEGALNVAASWAESSGTRLHLVRAVDVSHVSSERVEETLGERARELDMLLEARLSGARLSTLDPAPEVHCRPGHAAEVLLDVARQQEVDMLVLGEHKRRGLLDHGSTARAVLAHAPCPVWTQVGPVRVVRRVLVAVDLSEESRVALELACAVARATGASIQAVHVFRLPDFAGGLEDELPGPTYVIDGLKDTADEEFVAFLDAHVPTDVTVQKELLVGDPIHELVGRAKAGADLVVLGTHGRTGLSAWLLGSVARGVIGQSPIPVLTTRASDREWRLKA